MRQFQTLIFFLICNSVSYKALASCQQYIMHGRIENTGDKIVMLINPGSRSETVVNFPAFMEHSLKKEIRSRVQIEAPAEQIHRYSYRVHYQPGKVQYYPFSIETNDSIKLKREDAFSCE